MSMKTRGTSRFAPFAAVVCALLGALAASCSIIELPFKLIGFLIQGVFSLLQALVNVGSSAAMQVAKFAPIAMLFTQAETAPHAGNPRLDCPPTMERLAQALETAPAEILTEEQALEERDLCLAQPELSVLLLDPASLLREEGRREAATALEGRRILGVRWIAAGSSTSLLPPSAAAGDR